MEKYNLKEIKSKLYEELEKSKDLYLEETGQTEQLKGEFGRGVMFGMGICFGTMSKVFSDLEEEDKDKA